MATGDQAPPGSKPPSDAERAAAAAQVAAAARAAAAAAPRAGTVPLRIMFPTPGAVFPYVPRLGGAQLPLPFIHQQIEAWQGPFPPPEAVREYEKILPGTFNRLITMAEQAQAAQIETVRDAQKYSRRDTRRGHILGFLLSLAAMCAAAWCSHAGQPWVAVAFLSVPVMAVARALVETSKSKASTAVVGIAPDDQADAGRVGDPGSGQPPSA